MRHTHFFFFFFLNDTPTPEFYPLPLHDALPISTSRLWAKLSASATSRVICSASSSGSCCSRSRRPRSDSPSTRSEEHTSELQSRLHLVCRLLLEKKKKTSTRPTTPSSATASTRV